MKPTNFKAMCDGFHVAVLSSGFVYVGDTAVVPDEGLLITNAHNIRVWGTTRGLGELAQGGPTKDTKLDVVGTVLVPWHAVQHLILSHSDKWAK